MINGLSREQLALAGLHGVALLGSFVALLVGEWRWAAALALISFGLFSVLVILTLAAMTRSASRTRERVNAIRRDTRRGLTVSFLRRAEIRSEDRLRNLQTSVEAAEARTQAAERRLLTTLESHRLHVEKRLEQLAERKGEK